ncbi:hypothetical protein [Streptomyces sp. SAI-25]|uniref:hypothetical protein n=1 Tax=Streptomyces sp. SAI-25 TaxID=1472664 RepID=UPI0040394AE6
MKVPTDDLLGGARQQGQGRGIGPDDPLLTVEREHAHTQAIQHGDQLLLKNILDVLSRRVCAVAHVGSLASET